MLFCSSPPNSYYGASLEFVLICVNLALALSLIAVLKQLCAAVGISEMDPC